MTSARVISSAFLVIFRIDLRQHKKYSLASVLLASRQDSDGV
jgi:hypothetical protein